MNKPQVGIKLKVQFTKKAYKEFQKINKVKSKQFNQLFNALKELEKNPYSNKYKTYKRNPQFRRIRVRNYRICFKIQQTDIIVVRVRKRDKVYD